MLPFFDSPVQEIFIRISIKVIEREKATVYIPFRVTLKCPRPMLTPISAYSFSVEKAL